MPSTALISVLCPDKAGLVAAIAGRLFDLGVNLRDTSFAVLGKGAEFTAVCDLEGGLTREAVEGELRGLAELAGAEVSVRAFTMEPDPGPTSQITHHIAVTGGDQPGLIARLCEAFVEFGVNIVSLNAGPSPGREGRTYTIRISVWIPENAAEACLATVTNTAQHLGMTCRWDTA
jgi:glycine cleavage system transcriptional repressor